MLINANVGWPPTKPFGEPFGSYATVMGNRNIVRRAAHPHHTDRSPRYNGPMASARIGVGKYNKYVFARINWFWKTQMTTAQQAVWTAAAARNLVMTHKGSTRHLSGHDFFVYWWKPWFSLILNGYPYASKQITVSANYPGDPLPWVALTLTNVTGDLPNLRIKYTTNALANEGSFSTPLTYFSAPPQKTAGTKSPNWMVANSTQWIGPGSFDYAADISPWFLRIKSAPPSVVAVRLFQGYGYGPRAMIKPAIILHTPWPGPWVSAPIRWDP
jgi:hypothetical protein